MSQPLQGILVVDLTRLLPGPYTSMLLADLGARVIKVESPSAPDILRFPEPHLDGANVGFSMLNRNKESLLVELTDPEGAQAVARLARKADLLLTSTRPGWLEARGLGHQELSRHNPGLISCALRGYAEGSGQGQKGGHDINFLAVSGLAACLRDDQGSPIVPAAQIADIAGSLSAAIAILSALVERSQTGQGRELEISLTESSSGFTCLLRAHALLGREQSLFEQGALSGKSPVYRNYRCADGRWIALGALERKYQTRLLQRLSELTPENDLLQASQSWPDDLFLNWERSTEAVRVLESVFATRPRDEWVQLFDDLDVCLSPVLEVGESAASAPGAFVLDSQGRQTSQPAGLLDSEFPPPAPRRTAVAPGEHTRALLHEIGYLDTEIVSLFERGIAVGA